MRFRKPLVYAIPFFLFLTSACGAASSSCPAGMSARIPARPAKAKSGSEFARYVAAMTARDREQAIRKELLSGNIPGFLRKLKPVSLKVRSAEGGTVSARICVMPDYLAIGSDRDYLRIPANLYTARAVADAFGFSLPTTTIVDAVYRQAGYHLRPQPLPAGPTMRSIAYYVTHNRLIQKVLPADYAGGLVAGDKKDLVLTNRLIGKPTRIAIYGWHRLDGRPIQPLSTVHGIRYVDYSHGIRLVSDTVIVNGRPRSIYDVLTNPSTAPLLSREGSIDASRVLSAASSLVKVSALKAPALF